MVDMAAIASAATSLKTAFDLSKVALGLRDTALVKAKVTEMQGEISSALASAIAAQTDQIAMLERVRNLEEKIRKMEAWDAEKNRYEMKQLTLVVPSIAYAIKKNCQAADPFHCICATCYEKGEKHTLQFLKFPMMGSPQITLLCPNCKTEIQAEHWPPP